MASLNNLQSANIDNIRYYVSFSNQPYNVNTSHPLITNSQEYMFYKKFVSIHSEDRDIIKYPNSSEFEIELPEDYLNVSAIKLTQWTFPANYNTFSITNNNVLLVFKIENPYNPGANDVSNEYAFRIFEALFNTQGNEYSIIIEEGFYNPIQMATELQNKLNSAVTTRIKTYFIEQNIEHPSDGWDATLSQFTTNGGYNRFVVVYNSVSLKIWFGNNADDFVIITEAGLVTNSLSENLCFNEKKHLPDASNWGLGGYLGLARCNSAAVSSSKFVDKASFETFNGIVVPRFYYGDVTPGDNGFWLLPDTDLSGSEVYWVEPPFKVNLMGESFIYMEIAGQNCIDETKPFNFSNFTLTTNQTNGTVNAAFAKLPVPTTPLSQWFDRDSIPYKFYYPPAERIRKLKFKFRYHNGQPANFSVFNFSFMLEFTIMLPMILRETRSQVYPPPMGR